MHPLSFASLVVAAMVFIGGASIAAGDQPTPPVLPTGPLPTAPPGKVGYFALLQPVAQVRANQPGLDQFTTDLDIALRKAAPIAFSRLIGINAPAAKLVDARACASVHVHGFVWPGRSFKIDDTSVTVSARVRVIDSWVTSSSTTHRRNVRTATRTRSHRRNWTKSRPRRSTRSPQSSARFAPSTSQRGTCS